MKYIHLIAWREYAENAKTKGFWIGLLVVPLIIFGSIQIPIWLQKKGTPTRYYVLVDQSETLAPVIESRLERAQQRVDFASQFDRCIASEDTGRAAAGRSVGAREPGPAFEHARSDAPIRRAGRRRVGVPANRSGGACRAGDR